MSTVKRPTLDQMKGIVSSLHMSMSEREIAEYLDVMEGTFQAYDRVEQLPDNLPHGALSAHAGLLGRARPRIRSTPGR